MSSQQYQTAPVKRCRQPVHPHFYFEVKRILLNRLVPWSKQLSFMPLCFTSLKQIKKLASYVRMDHVPTMSDDKRRSRWGREWERWQRELVERRRPWVHGFFLQSDFRYVDYLQVEVISVDEWETDEFVLIICYVYIQHVSFIHFITVTSPICFTICETHYYQW